MIDGESSDDENVDPTWRVLGGEKVKDLDVDEAQGKNEEVYSKGGCREERFVILRDEEVGGLEMVTTDEDRVLRGD